MLKDPEHTLQVGTPAGRWAYKQAQTLGATRFDGFQGKDKCYCHGQRQFGAPLQALMVQKKLGSVRHALSQMVVAGTMVHQPPVEIRYGRPSGLPEGENVPTPLQPENGAS